MRQPDTSAWACSNHSAIGKLQQAPGAAMHLEPCKPWVLSNIGTRTVGPTSPDGAWAELADIGDANTSNARQQCIILGPPDAAGGQASEPQNAPVHHTSTVTPRRLACVHLHVQDSSALPGDAVAHDPHKQWVLHEMERAARRPWQACATRWRCISCHTHSATTHQ